MKMYLFINSVHVMLMLIFYCKRLFSKNWLVCESLLNLILQNDDPVLQYLQADSLHVSTAVRCRNRSQRMDIGIPCCTWEWYSAYDAWIKGQDNIERALL